MKLRAVDLFLPLVAAAALFVTAVEAASPTVGELLALCDRAMANGNRGVEAAACEWYTVPCDCKVRTPATEGLHWCVPEAEPADSTITKVLAVLRRHAELSSPADRAVAQAMARLYPCR